MGLPGGPRLRRWVPHVRRGPEATFPGRPPPGTGPGPPQCPHLTRHPLWSVDSLREGDPSLDQPAGLLQLVYTLPAELPPEGVAHARRAAVQRQPGAAGRAGGGRGRRCRRRGHLRGQRRCRPPARAPHKTVNVAKVTPSELSLTVDCQRERSKRVSVLWTFVCKDGSPQTRFSAQDYICNQKNHLAQEGELCMKLPSGFFNPLVNSDLLLFYTSSVKLCLQYFVSLFTNLAQTPATVRGENLLASQRGGSSLCTLTVAGGHAGHTGGTGAVRGPATRSRMVF